MPSTGLAASASNNSMALGLDRLGGHRFLEKIVLQAEVGPPDRLQTGGPVSRN
jgi:hypothetical protein